MDRFPARHKPPKFLQGETEKLNRTVIYKVIE